MQVAHAEQLVGHFIDGEESPAIQGTTFASVNPATEETIAHVAFGSAEDVDRAVQSAWKAYRDGSWSRTAPSTRARTMGRIGELIREQRADIGRLESLERISASRPRPPSPTSRLTPSTSTAAE
jgi:gamma-glutamyl-gamma-aminobutyraldehyde dehydrogenase